MRKTVPFVFIAFLLGLGAMYISCSKQNGKGKDAAIHINCDGLITDTLGTNDNGRVYMPNAFVPHGNVNSNGNGNDVTIFPITLHIASISFTIYDSLNNIVYTTDSLTGKWNGLPNDTTRNTIFYYRIQAITEQNRKIGLCGEVYRLVCFPANIPRSFFYFADQCTVNGFTEPVSEAVDLPTCP